MSARDGRPPGREEALAALRARAEAQLGAAPGGDELRRLLHEVSVYQAELTMQNEELRRSQAELEAARAGWQELFEQGPIPALAVGADGLVQEVNRAAAALLGGRDRVTGRAFSRLAAPGHEIGLQRVLSAALVGRPPGLAEAELRGPAGPVYAEVTAAPVAAPRDGRVLVFLRDLTERRSAEADRRRLAGQVERLQRLDALGRMAGAVAHEINNVLAVVMGNASAAAEAWRGQPAGAEFEEILAASRRGRDLTQRLLGFARQTPPHQEPVHPGDLVLEVAAFLRRVAGPSTRIEVVEGPWAGERVNGDPTQLHQAVLNLGLNACDALGPRGGRVTLRAGLVEVDAAEAARRPGLAPGRHVRIAVEDDGPGFTPEALERVFEPFFTTKAPGKGTGLGLAMVLGVARDHHGSAAVAERAGPGAEVELLLPVAVAGACREVAAPPPPVRRAAKGGLALVVDDEASVSRTLGRLLGLRGWEVETAGSGAEAVARFGALAARVGIVFLDLSMPGMGGLEVLERLRAVDPAVPVVLCSGYSMERVPAAVLSGGRTRFMAKPFDGTELDALLEALARHPGDAAPSGGEGAGRPVPA